MEDQEIAIDPALVKMARYKAQKSLLFHTRYFFKKTYNRKFVVGQHHKIICDALERVMSGNCKRLIINIAPRYGKTEVAVINLITHGLSVNPSAKFIHLSYSDDLALDNSERAKTMVNSVAYQELFPEVEVSKESKAKDKWYTTAGGGVLARSASGQVTGFGAGLVDDPEADNFIRDLDSATYGKESFGGAIIIDDPIKPEDADSDVVRAKINSRFDSTIRNRVNSRDTPIILIMQRLHPEDLAGYLQREEEEEKWEVIELPCLFENSLKQVEALWPFKHTVDELLKMKKSNELVYERQYNQNPKPKAGLMFPADDLNYFDLESDPGLVDALDDAEFVYLAGDPANLGGDDFAAPVGRLIGNRIYITNVIYNTLGTDYNETKVAEMIIKEKVHAAGIEGVFAWKDTAMRIRNKLDRIGWEGEFRILRPRTGKHSRINARSAFIRNHFYFIKNHGKMPEYSRFMKNLTSYLKIQAPGLTNKHDEAPDVCEMIGGYYERNFTHVDWLSKSQSGEDV